MYPRLACLLLVGCIIIPSPSRAEEVDVALALVSDVSRSIDDAEFAMQKQGYRDAFTNPRVIAAIQGGVIGAIGVTYIEFAGASETRTIVPWTIIRDAATATQFVNSVAAASRSAWGRTSISAGLDLAMTELARFSPGATRKVIDVAGDGTNNSGRDADEVRDEAVSKGITINGLAIINDHPLAWNFAHIQPPGGLDNWYRENVTGGPGSFVVAIHDFKDFTEALTRKLVNEISMASPADDQRSGGKL